MHVAGGRRKDRVPAGRWQKFTRRRGFWGVEALVLLLPGLVLFAMFVLQPEVAASSGPALLIDNLLRGLAVLAVAGTVTAACAEDALAARAAFVASAACLLLAVAVLFSASSTPLRDWTTLGVAGVATAAAATNLIRRRRVWKGIRGGAGKVLAGVLTLAAVPAFNFWAETSYLPSRNAASLEMSTEAVVQQDPAGGQHWVITSTIHNRSPVRAFVIVSSLTACNWADEVHWQRDVAQADRPAEQCRPLVAPFGRRSWLDPDVTLTISTPARLDTGRPLLQVRLRVAYARADRVIEVLDSARNATAGERGPCAQATVVDLQPQSRLAALARRELALMYADVEGDGSTAYFFGAADAMRCDRRPGDQHPSETRFHGLNQYLSLTEATTVRASWPGAQPAPAAPGGN